MEKSYSKSYAAAGVDVTAGYESVELIKDCIKKTNIPGVIGSIGGFGGMFELGAGDYKNPVLVSGTDGVGTKLKIAFLMDKHDTVGIDCVAMCVNDVACSGAKPLFFLDYIACGKNYPEKTAQIVSGVAEGCIQAGCALVGGETAEHPGLMPNDEYDLAGFTVGIGEKEKLVSGDNLKAGDALIGVASSGVHSNGFSLVRKVFNITEERLKVNVAELGKTLGEELLTPTRIYVKPLLALMDKITVNAISHITGGGFYENVPRMLNDGFTAVIEKDKCFKKPIFDLIAKQGDIPKRDMYNTFNMGTGLVIAVDGDKADEAVRILEQNGESAKVIGEIKNGEKGVELV
ncbi:MAG: phosphoribosylformylglycinamidine cyclo-ligase [Clostridiales bacterium]|nr:phosphoribosylformylglycinamidine cyclo-ligase [Clostridiales bacterium]